MESALSAFGHDFQTDIPLTALILTLYANWQILSNSNSSLEFHLQFYKVGKAFSAKTISCYSLFDPNVDLGQNLKFVALKFRLTQTKN